MRSNGEGSGLMTTGSMAMGRVIPQTKEEYKREALRLRTDAAEMITTGWLKWTTDPAGAYPKYREAAKMFEKAEEYQAAVFCHLWAAQFEMEAGHA